MVETIEHSRSVYVWNTPPSGPLGSHVVDAAPEPRHPTLVGAASTGPPVPTGMANAVVAVHGLGGGLDRVRCRGTLALQDISIVLQSYQLQAFLSIYRTENICFVGIATKYIFTSCVPRVAIYLPDLTAV